jgi:Universal stress protein family
MLITDHMQQHNDSRLDHATDLSIPSLSHQWPLLGTGLFALSHGSHKASVWKEKKMFQRTLMPVDGSERAEQAIPFAVQIARASRGCLWLVQVVKASPQPPHASHGGQAARREIEATQEYLAHLAQLAQQQEAGIQIHTRVLIGEVTPLFFWRPANTSMI